MSKFQKAMWLVNWTIFVVVVTLIFANCQSFEYPGHLKPENHQRTEYCRLRSDTAGSNQPWLECQHEYLSEEPSRGHRTDGGKWEINNVTDWQRWSATRYGGKP